MNADSKTLDRVEPILKRIREHRTECLKANQPVSRLRLPKESVEILLDHLESARPDIENQTPINCSAPLKVFGVWIDKL